jgi:hypothetical protein
VAGALAAVDVEDLAGHEADDNSGIGGSQNRSSIVGSDITV